ncbi:MAG: transglycosylase SLT domain-containing protein [Dokdonella sp.]
MRLAVGLIFVFVGGGLVAQEYAGASTILRRETVRIPDAAALYRRDIEQVSADVFGDDASPARLASQLHQESNFDPNAHAVDGGEGLGQFMPDTTEWIAKQFPKQLGQFDPWDPRQAVLATAVYDAFLNPKIAGKTPCDRWAFSLSSYNGGIGWLERDQKRAAANGADPSRWFDQVERFTARSAAARSINRNYVRRILLVLEPAYIEAGWSGQVVCS